MPNSVQSPNNKNNNQKKVFLKKTPVGGKKPGSSWTSYIATALLIFILLSGVYSLIANRSTPSTSIPLSQVSADVKSGLVSEIDVKGDSLDVLYKDGSKKTSQKENGTALSDTFAH